MADIVDMAQEQIEVQEALLARHMRYDLPAGVPGDCNTCGEPSLRLIGGDCAECREIDERRRKMATGEIMILFGLFIWALYSGHPWVAAFLVLHYLCKDEK